MMAQINKIMNLKFLKYETKDRKFKKDDPCLLQEFDKYHL